ncbi:GntR family transcriptional regulator [Streptomyces sp. NBC_01187]|uniref:GntR family transcriptional regulator n=1 Tax=Streptomyces sp. NBC_01187 TaxID=2903766 RepID=UPI00386AF7E8|nr:GntR family transcriptional regulator [Streptomyces sp. NBC_01187]
MGEPRYVAIADDLASRFVRGRWAVGDLLPPEPDLAAEYSVSRETLRRALKRLERAGLISRRKGTGTRLERVTPVNEFAAKLGSVEELTQYGKDAVREILSVVSVTVGQPLAVATGLPEGATRTCVTSVRRDPAHPDEAVSWAKVYLEPQDAQVIAADLGDSTRLISDLIEARTGRTVERVVQQVRAVAVPEEGAQLLGAAPGSLGLEFVRRYYDTSGALFEVTVSTHAGDRFVYETVLERR